MFPYTAKSQKDSLLMLWDSLVGVACPLISMYVFSAVQLPSLGANRAMPAVWPYPVWDRTTVFQDVVSCSLCILVSINRFSFSMNMISSAKGSFL
jgi:hypothetical protein